ncbi:MAG TPA: amino acid ABC transporter substrate-binding protein, partial [Telluria sp.]|nr:amino acid ABC transporter substrate-binding protein [Telluria sp.]
MTKLLKSARTRIALAVIAASSFGTAGAAELLVGVEIPLTGSLARVGMGMQEGIQVAADVFNKTNGKHTIKLITVDDESAPA